MYVAVHGNSKACITDVIKQERASRALCLQPVASCSPHASLHSRQLRHEGGHGILAQAQNSDQTTTPVSYCRLSGWCGFQRRICALRGCELLEVRACLMYLCPSQGLEPCLG